jgi:hypothetical protein
MRNWTFAFTLPMTLMMKLTDAFATDIRLPRYPAPPAPMTRATDA